MPAWRRGATSSGTGGSGTPFRRKGLGGRGEFIARTYRVVHDGRPFMLINEKFPVGVDPAPSLD